jgi:hypothetical protein
MKNSFTLNDLILSNFCETHDTGEIKISDLIQLDFDLKHEMEKQNGNSFVSPDKGIVHNILCYSLALCVFPTKRAGDISILMN